MTRALYLREAVRRLPDDAIDRATRAAIVRHYDRQVLTEWIARQWLVQDTWGWN